MKKNHYGKSYYQWQKKSGELGALIDLWKFKEFIRTNDTVLDFGCGGGYILAALPGKRKYGVDVNDTALRNAREYGIRTYQSIAELPRGTKYDVVLSHHTLEHVTNPAEILQLLHAKTRKGGYSVHVVPINDWRNDKKYDPNDINKHLYTWTPLLIGNLFARCGYTIVSIDILTHAWLPLSKYTYRLLPRHVYHVLCRIWSFMTRNRQIRIVARA